MDNKTEYLKELKDRILVLTENEHKEIFKFLKSQNCKYSENKNGIFINMTKLEKDVLDNLDKTVSFYEQNKIMLNNSDKIKIDLNN